MGKGSTSCKQSSFDTPWKSKKNGQWKTIPDGSKNNEQKTAKFGLDFNELFSTSEAKDSWVSPVIPYPRTKITTTTTKPQKNNNRPLQVQSYLFIKILITTTTTNQQYVNLPKQLLEFKKQLNSYMLPFSSLGHWRVRFSWSIQTYVLLIRLRDLFGLIIISKLYRHLIH